MKISKELYFDTNGKNLIQSLHNIKIIRRRFNRASRGYSTVPNQGRIISLNAPTVISTGWNFVEDILYIAGNNEQGKRKEYYCLPFTTENLAKLRTFLDEANK